eukprot:GFUD01071161.1.p1 GENE.GFUD01071161.1~~GFUD01071161.1.p1  ORF type:complete len:243 (-),score=48.34 GFUD01071161.1:550-1278(-)
MTDFDLDWESVNKEDICVYNIDPVVEDHFKKIGVEFNFNLVWCLARSAGQDYYNLDTKFERNFLNSLEENSLVVLNEFEEAWEIVQQTIIDDKYRECKLFEEVYNDCFTYELLFCAFSKSKGSFVNSHKFEEHLRDILTLNQPELLEQGVNKFNNPKRSKKNSLKSLLEARLRRQKQMEKYMKTVKDLYSGKVIYECKSCNFQSRWQRKLFYSHVIPEHIKSSNEIKQKKKNRKRKTLESKV